MGPSPMERAFEPFENDDMEYDWLSFRSGWLAAERYQNDVRFIQSLQRSDPFFPVAMLLALVAISFVLAAIVLAVEAVFAGAVICGVIGIALILAAVWAERKGRTNVAKHTQEVMSKWN